MTRRLAPITMALLAIALSAGVLTTPAGATMHPGSAGYEANLGVHHGYRIKLHTRGRQVEFEILKDGAYHHNGQFVAIYTVPGHFSATRLRANFGPFGKIDARFDATHESGGEPEGRPGCRYRSALDRRGVLRGTIRLRGQGGFVSIAPHAVRADYERYFPYRCEGESEVIFGGEPEEEGPSERPATASRAEPEGGGFYKAIVISYGQDGRRRTFFEDESFYPTNGNRAESRREGSFLDAGYRERRGRVDVLEHAFFDASAHFDLEEFDRGHVRATLAPPAPFSGVATFTQAGKGATPTLTGPLAISLPGAPDIPLTGPKYFSDLCTKEGEIRCRLEHRD